MDWTRSTRCESGDCIEIKSGTEMVGMRDSKDPGGPELWFPASVWGAFVAGVRAGEFDNL